MFTYGSKESIEYFILQHPELSDIVKALKINYPTATIYINQGNVIEVLVKYEGSNITDICDVVSKVCPSWDRERFLHGRYGFFVDYTDDEPAEDSYIF